MRASRRGPGARAAAAPWERRAALGLLLVAAAAWTLPPLVEELAVRPGLLLGAPRPEGDTALRWTPRGEAEGPGAAKGWRGLLLGLPLDLNEASLQDLEALPGVGPKTAEAIAATRRRLGGFRQVRDLERVPGVGPKTVERLAPWVRVGAAVR
ncbi:MAG: hypothetical protein Kow0092_30730 [Deferrisomatales bacterium]